MIRAVLFDLDGTLLDSAPDLIATLNHLRSGLGLAAIPVDDLRHFATRGAPGILKAGMPPCDDAMFEVRRRSFLGYYERHSFVYSAPFDGVDALLAGLGQRGVPWGIVTNKLEYLSFPILEKTGWLHSASAVICGDTVERPKPHPEPLLLACENMGMVPENVLMVGDDPRDMEAGKAAGCHTAFALYGYVEPGRHYDFGADTALIVTPKDVLGLLEK